MVWKCLPVGSACDLRPRPLHPRANAAPRSALDTHGFAQGELMRSSHLPLIRSIEHYDLGVVDVRDHLTQVPHVKPLIALRALHEMIDLVSATPSASIPDFVIHRAPWNVRANANLSAGSE
jgi:hypothetical protein